MQKLIDTSTAFYGAGNAPTRKLFKLSSGSYSGRAIAIYSQSASVLKFSYADTPYSNWSTPQEIANDAADYPVSGVMDDNGNVYLVYTKQTSNDLIFRKLGFSSGSWAVGSEVIIYNDKDNYFPSVVKDLSGKLTVCWTCYDSGGGTYTIRAKQSSDDGATWGSGPADVGTALTAGSSGCYCQAVCLGSFIYCFYTDGGVDLAYRRIADGGIVWDSEVLLYNGSGLDDKLSVAVSLSGSMIGVAFTGDSKLWFLEYDTSTWSGLHEIATNYSTAPLVQYNGANAYVTYGNSIGSGQIAWYYRSKEGSGFQAAVELYATMRPFAFVFLYDDDGSPQYQSLTTEAADSTAADVVHPSSSRLIAAINDAIYLGATEKFAACNVILSTAGDTNGRVSWAYFDGNDWQAFTPSSGAYHFDQLSKLVRLWTDTASAPTDWQKSSLQGQTEYWIKITVTTAYTTAPIGSQLTPLGDTIYLNH